MDSVWDESMLTFELSTSPNRLVILYPTNPNQKGLIQVYCFDYLACWLDILNLIDVCVVWIELINMLGQVGGLNSENAFNTKPNQFINWIINVNWDLTEKY